MNATASATHSATLSAIHSSTGVPERGRGASIHQLLPRVMKEIGAVAKANIHRQMAYRFRSIDDALNAIQPALVKHRVAVSFRCYDHRTETQRVRERGAERLLQRTWLLLELTFWAPDGSSLSSTAAGEGLDIDGDKSTAKAMANAMKYALFFGLLIPVGYDPDPRLAAEASQAVDDPSPDDVCQDDAYQLEQPRHRPRGQRGPNDRPQRHRPQRCSEEQAVELRRLLVQAGTPLSEVAKLMRQHRVSDIGELTEIQAERLADKLIARIQQAKQTSAA